MLKMVNYETWSSQTYTTKREMDKRHLDSVSLQILKSQELERVWGSNWRQQ